MELSIVNPIEESSWDDWVLKQPGATIFHSSSWAQVLNETYGYQPLYAVLESSSQRAAALPLMEVSSGFTGTRGVSLPFADFCPPLSTDDVERTLVERCLDYGRKRGWNYFEWRGGSFSDAHPVPWTTYLVHRLRLEAPEEKLWGGLRASNRRNIRRARAREVEIAHLGDDRSVEDYYVLHCKTRRKHGLPPQPIRLFTNIQKYIFDRGRGFVTLARCEGRVVAGAIFFHFGDEAVYKFGASDLAFSRRRPNNLVLWDAIRHCRSLQLACVSFGRTNPKNAGLLQFKRGWGAEEQNVSYFRAAVDGRSLGIHRGHSALGVFTKKIVQRIPLAILRVAGELSYRHMG